MKNSLNKLTVLLISSSPLTLAFYPVTPQTYQLTADFSGQNFFNSFNFFSDPDPTNGHVQYVNMTTANSTGLAGFLTNTHNNDTTRPPQVYLGVDSTNPSTPSGRPSTRVSSIRTFNHSLIIADIQHMPAPICGTWPAYWLLGTSSPWPTSGEIDILENVNTANYNKYTLHTDAGIKVANYTGHAQAGLLTSSDCDVNSPSQTKNVGCSVSDSPLYSSYGDAFNTYGGGIYATLIDHAGIRIWFFPRDRIPIDITMGYPTPPSRSMMGPGNDSTWSIPNARFDGPGNDFGKHFRDMQIIFNIGFCGDWAGKTWEESGCAASTGVKTCEEYVGGNAEDFVDVWWGINGVKVYEVGGGVQSNGTGNGRGYMVR